MKLALLPAPAMREKLFTTNDLNQLATLVELVTNESDDVDHHLIGTLAADAEVIVTSWGCPALDVDLLEKLPRLRLVIHAAGSVKPLVTPALWERGIRVSSGHESLGIGVAETALGMTIVSLKNLWRLAASAADGGWREHQAGVRELYGITVGVVGAGKAGRHYISLLQAFDVDVVVYDPTWSPDQIAALGARQVPLTELLTDADVVSLHAPAIPATHHLLDTERLQLMKDDAVLINTARGSLIDEDALVDELRTGRLFACLDVTDPEPPAPDHPLRSMPNCVLTGHVAGAVTNGLRRLGRYTVEETRRYLADVELTGELGQDDLTTMA